MRPQEKISLLNTVYLKYRKSIEQIQKIMNLHEISQYILTQKHQNQYFKLALDY